MNVSYMTGLLSSYNQGFSAESLTILVGLAISCLKLIFLNNDLSCLLSGLLRLDDIKQELKSPVRIVSFPSTTAQAKILSSLVIN